MPERPFLLGRRGAVTLAIVVLAAIAWIALDLQPGLLVPRAGGAAVAQEVFAAALHPALDYESVDVPRDAPAFLLRVLAALRRTIVFAVAAMSLALPVGLFLGVLASSTFWSRGPARRRRPFAIAVQASIRLLVALMRSVHELLWAVVFLAALGIHNTAAVVAIALPFAGVLAKVFSEVLDEAPAGAGEALRAAGAGPLQRFLFGTLPRAAPDMAAYTFYRFECAVRASAVLGFFGYETLGYYLKLSFENLHYREVWTYVYALVSLVLVLELWSSALRRRFVA